MELNELNRMKFERKTRFKLKQSLNKRKFKCKEVRNVSWYVGQIVKRSYDFQMNTNI